MNFPLQPLKNKNAIDTIHRDGYRTWACQSTTAYYSVQNSATFPMLLLKSSKKVVFLSEISSK